MSKKLNQSKKSNLSKKCGPGEILRKGFKRNKFTRKDGTVVPTSYVPPTCVPDFGKVGRGRKTLPPPDNLIHLSAYGYSIHKPDSVRKEALRAAAKDYDVLPVLRRLNLLRNYQAIPENKEIFSRDVEFMKDMYDPYRKTHRRAPPYKVWENENDLERWQNLVNRNYYRTKKRKNQRGGNDVMLQDPTTPIDVDTSTTDDMVDNITLPESTIEINTIIDRQKVCDAEGNCGVSNIIYEMHEVDGKKILYYTLEEKDIDDILQLDKIYMDSNRTRNDVQQNIINNSGLLIGTKIDDKFQGYFQYDPHENMDVEIVWFCANKGYGTTLYVFMEKYFKMNNYIRIILTISLEGSHSTRLINFWYSMGFKTYETIPEKNKVHMEKFI
jgi:hypothetical protein